MVTITLANGESREHEKISIEGGLLVGYEVREVEGGWDEESAVKVYPEGAVMEVDIDDDESLGSVSGQSPAPDKYIVETVQQP